MGNQINRFGAQSETAAMADVLERQGGIMIESLVAPEVMDRVNEEVARNVPAEDLQGNSALWPEGTRTVGGLAGVSRTYAEELLTHPTILQIADAVLKPAQPMAPSTLEEKPLDSISVDNLDDGSQQLVIAPTSAAHCHHYTAGACVMLEVAGGRDQHQILHRENSIYQPFVERLELPEYILSTMWAGTDFTVENGATRLVPGSHRWPESRLASASEIVQAVMPKGSVVLWLSRTLHGAAKTSVSDRRTGFFGSYIADWFRQEENQYIAVPPAVASTYSDRACQLLGYTCSDTLGWVKGRDKHNLLRMGRSGQL